MAKAKILFSVYSLVTSAGAISANAPVTQERHPKLFTKAGNPAKELLVIKELGGVEEREVEVVETTASPAKTGKDASADGSAENGNAGNEAPDASGDGSGNGAAGD